MAAQAEPDRWQEIQNIHQEYAFGYRIGASLLLVIVGVLIGGVIFAGDIGFQSNVYTEALSVIVTILVLDKLAERREENRRIKDLKAQLVRDAGGQSNESAKRAIDELRAHGWLTGSEGLLQEADLGRANLQQANLQSANLQDANLQSANLQEANLFDANLQEANLHEANLQRAMLGFANLQEANLFDANLQRANLGFANLQEAYLQGANLQKAFLQGANLQEAELGWANLQEANLQGANLQNVALLFANLQGVNLTAAQFDEGTLLPDETYWVRGCDLERFTNFHHPDFWRSDNPISPAYGGKADKVEPE